MMLPSTARRVLGMPDGPQAALRRLLAAGALCMLATLTLALMTGSAQAASRAAAEPPWTQVTSPGGNEWNVHDASCFGTAGLALAGDGHVAVSRDAGSSWTVVVPEGHIGTAFTAVAFTSSGHGAIASGGLLLVSADWGATWAPPAYVGPGPTGAVRDIVMDGTRALAVGSGGMILSSEDSGATWQVEDTPAIGTLTCAALASDGTALAGSDAGEILVRTTSWAVAGSEAAPITGVAAAPTPTWGDGSPDLFAATGHDVFGSDDGLTFASLPGLPDLTADSWPALAWAGQPDGSVIVAGPLQAGFFGSDLAWAPGATGASGLLGIAAPGGQSVAYVFGAEGRLFRTLSAGRDPAAATLSKGRIKVGSKTRLSTTVAIAAPGTLQLRSRIPGRGWKLLRSVAWGTADWQRSVQFDLRPSRNHDYRLDFKYGGTVTPLTSAASVIVAPKVATAKARYDLRRGAVFRFSGSVSPRLRGERVQLYTDRGGKWRPVSLQKSVKLRNGRTWQSRGFGTPKSETYHLRARLRSTRTHAAAWSRVVTVRIR